MPSRCAYSTATDDNINISELGIDSDQVRGDRGYLGSEGEWSCPRKTKDEAKYCLFHTPPEDRELSGSQISQIILDTFNESNSHKQDDGIPSWRPWDIVTKQQNEGAHYRRLRKQFIGAKLSDVTIEFQYANCSGGDNYPIDLRGATIREIKIWKANIVGGLRLQGATLVGNEEEEKCGELSGIKSRFDGTLELSNITTGELSLDETIVSGDIQCDNAEIAGSVSFHNAKVHGNIDFDSTDIDGEINLSEAIVDGEVEIYGAKLKDFLCENASIETLRIFNESNINGYANLSDTEFYGELEIESKAFDHPCVHSIDLSASTIVAGKLAAHEDPPIESDKNNLSSGAPFIFDLSKSEIGDVKIAPNCNCESVAALEHAYICESTLTEFPFKHTANRSGLRATDWKVHSLAPGGHTIRSIRNEYKKYNEYGTRPSTGAGKVAEQIIRELRIDESLQTQVINQEWDCVVNQYGNLYNGPSSKDLDQTFEAIQRETEYQTARPFEDYSRVTPQPLRSRITTKTEEQPLEQFIIYPCDPDVSESGVYVCDQTALLDVVHLITKNIRSVQEHGKEPSESIIQRWHGSLTTVIAHRFALERDVHPTPGELESTYLLAKNGAGHEGDQMAAGKFFQIEKLWARRQYITDFDETTIKDIYRYFSNLLFSAIAGYGERPQRVLGWSLVVICISTLFYWGIGNRLLGGGSDMTIVEAIIASFGSFVTLFLQPDSLFSANLLKLSAQIEGFIGVFSISLFVYTLTRSVHR